RARRRRDRRRGRLQAPSEQRERRLQGVPVQRRAALRRPRDRTVDGAAAARRAVTYLLDTNVISEGRKRRPDPRVVRWIAEVASSELFLSVLRSEEHTSEL